MPLKQRNQHEFGDKSPLLEIKITFLLRLHGRLIGLVSLFNGISTFVDYLMPKPFP